MKKGDKDSTPPFDPSSQAQLHTSQDLPSTESKAAAAKLARKRRRDTMLLRRAAKLLIQDGGEESSTSPDEEVSSMKLASSSSAHAASPENVASRDAPPVMSPSMKRAPRPQRKYVPDVPMSKEQLSVWRRDQRRARNRESAAKSRIDARQRIAELEEEVEEWKQKYNMAMERLRRLESRRDTQFDHSYPEHAQPDQSSLSHPQPENPQWDHTHQDCSQQNHQHQSHRQQSHQHQNPQHQSHQRHNFYPYQNEIHQHPLLPSLEIPNSQPMRSYSQNQTPLYTLTPYSLSEMPCAHDQTSYCQTRHSQNPVCFSRYHVPYSQYQAPSVQSQGPGNTDFEAAGPYCKI